MTGELKRAFAQTAAYVLPALLVAALWAVMPMEDASLYGKAPAVVFGLLVIWYGAALLDRPLHALLGADYEGEPTPGL